MSKAGLDQSVDLTVAGSNYQGRSAEFSIRSNAARRTASCLGSPPAVAAKPVANRRRR